MSPETDPATMSRPELVKEARELGMQHIEHLHIEELAEAVAESREAVGAGSPPEPPQPGQSA